MWVPPPPLQTCRWWDEAAKALQRDVGGAGPAAGGCQVEGGTKPGAGCRGEPGSWWLGGEFTDLGKHTYKLVVPKCPRTTMGTVLYMPLGAGVARQRFGDGRRELGKPLDPRPPLTN